jgi:hypothetical protein
MFLVTEQLHVYGPTLIGTAIFSATVVWQTNKGIYSLKNEIKASEKTLRGEI